MHDRGRLGPREIPEPTEEETDEFLAAVRAKFEQARQETEEVRKRELAGSVIDTATLEFRMR